MKKVTKKVVRTAKKVLFVVTGAGLWLWSAYNLKLMITDGLLYGGAYGFRRYLRYDVDGAATFIFHAIMYLLMFSAITFVAALFLHHYLTTLFRFVVQRLKSGR